MCFTVTGAALGKKPRTILPYPSTSMVTRSGPSSVNDGSMGLGQVLHDLGLRKGRAASQGRRLKTTGVPCVRVSASLGGRWFTAAAGAGTKHWS